MLIRVAQNQSSERSNLRARKNVAPAAAGKAANVETGHFGVMQISQSCNDVHTSNQSFGRSPTVRMWLQ
jgi:hypothetical protein